MKTDFPNSIKALRIDTNILNGTNNHIFREDIKTFIMPIYSESKNFPNYCVELIGEESEKETALAVLTELSEYNNYYNGEYTQLLSDVISYIASNLSWKGWAVYEILYDTKKCKLRFNHFTTENLFKILKWYIQIPKQILKNKDKVNILDDKNIWKIEMPPELGGQKEFEKILSSLKKFGSHIPNFYLDDIKQQYDHHMYRESTFIFHTKAALKWGWSQRDLDRDSKTEFYLWYQHLTFQWALAILRNHILMGLNTLLERLEVDCKITISGLPEPDEIIAFRDEFEKGNKTLDEVLKFNSYI